MKLVGDCWRSSFLRGNFLWFGGQDRAWPESKPLVIFLEREKGGQLQREEVVWPLKEIFGSCVKRARGKENRDVSGERRQHFFRVKLGENRGEGEVENYGELSFKITGKQLEENRRKGERAMG